MRRYGYAFGMLSSLLLPALVIVLIAARADEMPRMVSVWVLLAALGTSVMTWWLQGLIYAVLARPQLKGLRVGDMFCVEMAGLFVALVSPIRGAELPYKAYLLKGRLGLSAPEGTNVVLTRVLLDGVVLTPAALVGFALYSSALPQVPIPNLPLAGLVAAAVVLATIAFLVCRRRVREGAGKRTSRPGGSKWQAKARAKVSGFLGDMQTSFTSYWRPGYRTILLYAVALTTFYWALRLCAGPLALMAVGWSGDWTPVVVAQLLLVSFVLPFAPTPGGGGVREVGLATLLSGYVAEGQLLSGLIVYTALSHWLPLIASACFAAHQLWWRISRRGGGHEAAHREGRAEPTTTRDLPASTHTPPRRRYVLSGNQEPDQTSAPTERMPEESRA